MKITLKNLGVLKHAEFSLGDLTIICGENNTGKTYATYALYGFLNSWRGIVDFKVSDSQIQRLLTDGGLKIGLAQYVEKVNSTLSKACREYTKQLYSVFAAPSDRFSDSEFRIQTERPRILDKVFNSQMGLPQEGYFSYSKEKGSDELTVSLPVKTEQESEISPGYAQLVLSFILKDVVLSSKFPSPFISSAERTGVAIFRKELNFARNRLLDEMVRMDQKINPQELLSKTYQSYPRPIEENVDFMRQLEDITKRKSFITAASSEVLEDFADIIGGEYEITQNDQLYYTPRGTRLELTMDQSSSAVRSLLDIGFYLRHVAYPGNLLMVDEPELNLHPTNQRRIARLFARLVNLGVKIFITTHSDYIVKELNTLIMLNRDRPHLKRIAQENRYREDELVDANQVKVYMTEKEDGGYTLVEADIDPELGIEAPSFDGTIDEMNRIQRDIVWGRSKARE